MESIQIKKISSMNLFHRQGFIACVFKNSVLTKSIKIQAYGGANLIPIMYPKFSLNSQFSPIYVMANVLCTCLLVTNVKNNTLVKLLTSFVADRKRSFHFLSLKVKEFLEKMCQHFWQLCVDIGGSSISIPTILSINTGIYFWKTKICQKHANHPIRGNTVFNRNSCTEK